MNQGTIVSLREGFGFIKSEGMEKDLFFHANDLNGVSFDSLREGDVVKFGIGEGPKGKNATEVTKA